LIVPMKKIILFMVDSEKNESLEYLREAGVLHIEKKSVNTEKFLSLMEIKNRIDAAKITLSDDCEILKDMDFSIETAKAYLLQMESLAVSKKQLSDRQSLVLKECERLAAWGDFDPAALKDLSEKGFSLRIISQSTDSYSEESDGYRIILGKTKSSVRYVLINSESQEIPEGSDELLIPEKGLGAFQTEMTEIEKQMKSLEDEILQESTKKEQLTAYEKWLEQALDFETVGSGMDSQGIFSSMSGFMPTDSVDSLKTRAEEKGWGLIVTDPAEEDLVPTKIKNNKIVSLIEPMFQLLEVVPGYREFDISLEFLLFFTLFFAMIVGDAGYGILFLGIAALVHMRMKKGNNALYLLYVLSAATVVWGTMTGTWFGSQTILASVPFLQKLVIPQLASFPEVIGGNYDSTYVVKYFCFVIGTLQLSLARIRNFIRQMPSVQAPAQLGWLSMLIGMYHLVLFLVLAVGPIPQYALYLIGGGFALVVIFGEQKKGVNFMKGLLLGFAGLFNNFLDTISLLSHIISYIRLFAVGLASVAIASSFNAMAAPMMEGPAIIGAVIILILGHGLNIIMGALSLIVHGVRLNLLEFSGHLDMEWSGIKYEPFQKADIKMNN